MTALLDTVYALATLSLIPLLFWWATSMARES